MRYLERTSARRKISVAAQYEPGRPLDELRAVAARMDSGAQIAEVPGLAVLLVRYLRVPDDHPARTDYEVVEAGHFLVYSETFDVLYSDDPESFRREHEPA